MTNPLLATKAANFESDDARRERVPRSTAIAWPLVALAAAALIQLAVYGNGGHDALGDIPGRFLAWRLGGHVFPYLDRGVEYPVVIGYLAYALASITGTATRFFIANGVIDAALVIAMTCLLRERGGRRIWRWIAAPPLVFFAFHNWDMVAIVPAIVGLLAYAQGADRLAGASLAFGASTKVFPGLFVVPLAIMRWCDGRRRDAIRLVAWAAGVLALLNGPIFLLDRPGWWYPAEFQGRRDATWGSLWYWLLRLPEFAHLEHGNPAELANVLGAVVLVVALAFITVLAVQRHLDAIAIGAAVTAAFVLTNKVYSPNYDLWLVPFFVLLPVTRKHWLAFCAADIGIFALVYGHFHGLWSAHVVRGLLPPFVMLRAATLVLLIIYALGGDALRLRRSAPSLVA
jgi:hypothetical protein